MKPLTIGSVTIPTHPVPYAERLIWCNSKPQGSELTPDMVRHEFAAAALATGFRAPGCTMLELGDRFAADLAARTPQASDGDRWHAIRPLASVLLVETWAAPSSGALDEVERFLAPTTEGGPSSDASSPTAGEAMPSSG